MVVVFGDWIREFLVLTITILIIIHIISVKATFSPDGESIICGSEDHRFYTWNRESPTAGHSGGLGGLGSRLRKSSQRRDRNEDYQRFDAHNASCTVASFVPPIQGATKKREVILSADYHGTLQVYIAYRFERS